MEIFSLGIFLKSKAILMSKAILGEKLDFSLNFFCDSNLTDMTLKFQWEKNKLKNIWILWKWYNPIIEE